LTDPILKWAGGKKSLLREIRGNFPFDYRDRRYHEPFLGGGAVFFWLKPQSGTVNDVNRRLMNFYRIVRDRPEELIEKARRYRYDEKTYYELRERFNSGKTSDVEEAALLLYFNRTAFNGLYRENSKGEFNVPFGDYKNPRIVHEAAIRAACNALKKVELLNLDFAYILHYAKEGDICYFDPPYQPVSETANFTEYSKDGFGFEEQERLRDVCMKLHERGVFFVLSNSYSEEVRTLFEDKGFRIEQVSAKRSISSDASTRGEIPEILVSNVPQNMMARGKQVTF
jgi:DNA adenine methylase